METIINMAKKNDWSGFSSKTKKPRKKPVYHESKLQQACMAEWNLKYDNSKYWLHAIPNGGFRNKKLAVELAAEGVKRGVFDLFMPVKRGNYCGLYIEMKYGRNGLTKEQKEFKAHCIEQGYCTAVAYSVEEFLKATENYLNL